VTEEDDAAIEKRSMDLGKGRVVDVVHVDGCAEMGEVRTR